MITVTITPSGAGTVELPEGPYELASTTPLAARDEAADLLVQRARESGEELSVVTRDGEFTTWLRVHPDGRIDEVDEFPDPSPPPRPASPPSAHLPGDEPTVTLPDAPAPIPSGSGHAFRPGEVQHWSPLAHAQQPALSHDPVNLRIVGQSAQAPAGSEAPSATSTVMAPPTRPVIAHQHRTGESRLAFRSEPEDGAGDDPPAPRTRREARALRAQATSNPEPPAVREEPSSFFVSVPGGDALPPGPLHRHPGHEVAPMDQQPTERQHLEPPRPAPPPGGKAPLNPHSHDHDPEWLAFSQQPAASGIRSLLRRPPGPKEIEKRRVEFAAMRQRSAEEERHAEEERDRAEKAERVHAARERRRQAREETLERVIQTNHQRTVTVLVANPKGGARKTTTSYLLGATFGSIRGGSTVAWDANETMGTLGERAQPDRHSRTVVDLLEDGAQHFLNISSARVGILDSYVRNQGSAHFDVLASDENPNRQDQINADGFRKVHDILSHFYRMILVDTGNNIRADHFVEAQNHTDQLVIPVAASHDSKNRALDMMSSFSSKGFDHLVAQAIVLVHELEPIERHPETGAPLDLQRHQATVQEISEAFAGKVRAVLPVPFDPSLKDGGRIDYFKVSQETIRAYRDAAGTISMSLIESLSLVAGPSPSSDGITVRTDTSE